MFSSKIYSNFPNGFKTLTQITSTLSEGKSCECESQYSSHKNFKAKYDVVKKKFHNKYRERSSITSARLVGCVGLGEISDIAEASEGG